MIMAMNRRRWSAFLLCCPAMQEGRKTESCLTVVKEQLYIGVKQYSDKGHNECLKAFGKQYIA